MKRNYIRNSIIAGLTILSVSFIIANPVARAENAQPQDSQTTGQDKSSTDPSTATKKQAPEVEKQTPETKLTDVKLKECESHQTAITNIMARISDRGQKQIDLFTTITDRVEKFYTDKGNTLATYDTLVAAVTSAKVTAQTAVNTTKTTSTGFACGISNPKGVADTFKASLKSEIGTLNDYKTAVKDLIVGVKSVESTTTAATTTSQGNK